MLKNYGTMFCFMLQTSIHKITVFISFANTIQECYLIFTYFRIGGSITIVIKLACGNILGLQLISTAEQKLSPTKNYTLFLYLFFNPTPSYRKMEGFT